MRLSPASPADAFLVLVAVYNAEATLARALDSLLAQTYTHWQAVCVDDGSTDGSWKILQDYAARDARFTIIHLEENGGAAHARNVGLRADKESGFVTFLDSDDWLSADALQRAYATFATHPDTDCVLFRLVITGKRQGESAFPLPSFDALTGQEAFEQSLDWSIHGCYVARRALYDRYAYDESCRGYSDDLVTHLHYYLSKEVRACAGTYYYWYNDASVTRRISVRYFDLCLAKSRMRQYLLELKVPQSVLDRYENLRWLALVDAYMFYHVHGRALSADERRQGLSIMRKMWQTIDRRALSGKLTRKFGYCPMGSWPLFRLQEWGYFTIRGWLGKNR